MKPLIKVILWTTAILIAAAMVFLLFFQQVLTRHSPLENAQAIPAYSIPAPDPSQSYLHFIAIGDVGKGNWIQRAVGRSMANKAKQAPLDFVLLLGDNFYWDGVQSIEDQRWQHYFIDSYLHHPELQVPYYAVLGNHDYLGNPQAQVDYTQMSDYWVMPACYFTFSKMIDEDTEVQFFALDTEMLFYGDDVAEPQYHWLERELAQSQATWKIVYGHHQVYSNYEGEKVINQPRLAALLDEYEVDAYLSGHLHIQALFERFDGVQHIVSGSGSSHQFIWTDASVYAATDYGFTWYRLGRDELVVEFVSTQGLWQLLRGQARTHFAHTIKKP